MTFFLILFLYGQKPGSFLESAVGQAPFLMDVHFEHQTATGLIPGAHVEVEATWLFLAQDQQHLDLTIHQFFPNGGGLPTQKVTTHFKKWIIGNDVWVTSLDNLDADKMVTHISRTKLLELQAKSGSESLPLEISHPYDPIPFIAALKNELQIKMAKPGSDTKTHHGTPLMSANHWRQSDCDHIQFLESEKSLTISAFKDKRRTIYIEANLKEPSQEQKDLSFQPNEKLLIHDLDRLLP